MSKQSDAGKGDRNRSNSEQYREGWERIFKKQPAKEQSK